MDDGFIAGTIFGICLGVFLCFSALALMCWGYTEGKEAAARAATPPTVVEEAQK